LLLAPLAAAGAEVPGLGRLDALHLLLLLALAAGRDLLLLLLLLLLLGRRHAGRQRTDLPLRHAQRLFQRGHAGLQRRDLGGEGILGVGHGGLLRAGREGG
jgi:hypothetical protein